MPSQQTTVALKDSLNEMVQGAQAATDLFNRLAGSLRGFVEAFAPSSILAFDLAMRDLAAVIGSAVQPVFDQMTATVKEFSSILLPAIEQMRPAVAQFTEVLASVVSMMMEQLASLAGPVVSLVGALGEMLKTIQPLLTNLGLLNLFVGSVLGVALQLLAALFKILAAVLAPVTEFFGLLQPVVRVLTVIFQALGEALGAWVGGLFGVGEQFASLRGAMESFAKAVLLASIYLAKLFGADSFVAGLEKALGGNRKSAEGYGAPRDARVGTEGRSFGREVAALAALANGTGGGVSAEDAFRASLLKLVGEAKDKTPEEVAKKFKPLMDELAKHIVNAIKGEAWGSVSPWEQGRRGGARLRKWWRGDGAQDANARP